MKFSRGNSNVSQLSTQFILVILQGLALLFGCATASAQTSTFVGFPVDGPDSITPVGDVAADGEITYFLPFSPAASGTYGVDAGTSADTGDGNGNLQMYMAFGPLTGPVDLNTARLTFDFEDLDLTPVNDPDWLEETFQVTGDNGATPVIADLNNDAIPYTTTGTNQFQRVVVYDVPFIENDLSDDVVGGDTYLFVRLSFRSQFNVAQTRSNTSESIKVTLEYGPIEKYDISGTVILRETNNGLPGFSVNGTNIASGDTQGDTSDATGDYTLTSLPNGSHQLAINSLPPQYRVFSLPGAANDGLVTVAGANLSGQNIILECAPGYIVAGNICSGPRRITGVATLEPAGTPIRDVSVSAANIGSTRTLADGSYEISNVPDGDVVMQALKPGYQIVSPILLPITVVVAGADVVQNFRYICAPGYSIVGDECLSDTYVVAGQTVFQSDGVAVPGVSIEAGVLGTATTAGTGKFRFNGVVNGSYTLRASKPGYIVVDPDTQPVPVTVNFADVAQMFRLACDTGYVRDGAECVPVFQISGTATLRESGAAIRDVAITGAGGLSSTSTDASGNYSLTNVKNGDYELGASKPGYRLVTPTSSPVAITVNGADVVQNFLFECSTGYREVNGTCSAVYEIAGTVKLENTETPIADVSINGVVPATTDVNGKYSISNVSNGTYTLTASKTGYRVVSTPNPVQVAGSSLGGLDFIMACADGFFVQNGTCVPAGTEIVISASDGTSKDHVAVTWDQATCAKTYTLYRSDVEADVKSSQPFATDLTESTLLDTFATPGVTYYYHVVALNPAGTKCNESNVDPGYRLTDDGKADCDGDEVSDEQEEEDGTLICDPGSFHKRLTSPVFAKYNVFLSQNNFLELMANGTKPVQALVTIYDINGTNIAEQSVSLQPGQQIDVDINAKVGGIDTYGIVRVDWNDEEEGATLLGRMSNYRRDPNGDTFSFAFAKELLNAVKGPSYATGNSIDPQGMGFLVPNWAEIINLENFTQTFTFRLRNQDGQLVDEEEVIVPPLGERDVQAGHETGQGVYLAEVIPHNGAANYLLTVSRYSSNSSASDEADTYNFAFAIPGRKGTADRQFVPISNETGACYSTANWVEVANTKNKAVEAFLVFRDSSGARVGESTLSLAPYSQIHVNGGGMLQDGDIGTVEVSGNDVGSLIAQSLVYFHDCEDNLTQSAYVVPGRVAGPATQQGTFNRFIGFENRFHVYATTTETLDYTLVLQSQQDVLANQAASFGNFSATTFDLNNSSVFNTTPDTYGTVTLSVSDPSRVIGQVIRVRMNPNDPRKVDIAVPTWLE